VYDGQTLDVGPLLRPVPLVTVEIVLVAPSIALHLAHGSLQVVLQGQ